MKQITAPEGYEPTSAPVERDAHIAKRLETCLIGTIIADPRAVVEANKYIRDPSWMYYLRHSWIFEAANNIHKNGGSVNLMTIVDELDRQKRLEPAGGMAAIAKAAEYILVNENIEYACRAVVQAYLNRRLESLASSIAERSYNIDDAGGKQMRLD